MSYVLDAFEVVAAPGGRLLARVTGRWEAEASEISALVIDGRTVTRAPLLPGPTGPTHAFALPPDAIVPRAVFALELADGTLIDLPAPRVRPLAAPVLPTPAPEPTPAAEPESGRVEDLKQRMSSLLDAYAKTRRDLHELRRAHVRLEAERDEARQAASAAEEVAGRARAALERAEEDAVADRERSEGELAKVVARVERA